MPCQSRTRRSTLSASSQRRDAQTRLAFACPNSPAPQGRASAKPDTRPLKTACLPCCECRAAFRVQVSCCHPRMSQKPQSFCKIQRRTHAPVDRERANHFSRDARAARCSDLFDVFVDQRVCLSTQRLIQRQHLLDTFGDSLGRHPLSDLDRMVWFVHLRELLAAKRRRLRHSPKRWTGTVGMPCPSCVSVKGSASRHRDTEGGYAITIPCSASCAPGSAAVFRQRFPSPPGGAGRSWQPAWAALVCAADRASVQVAEIIVS